jgi:hypothetical protein
MVLMPAHITYNGKARFTLAKIDSCIAPLIQRLNAAGVFTTNCCCGHGKGEGCIILQDDSRLYVQQSDEGAWKLIRTEPPS